MDTRGFLQHVVPWDPGGYVTIHWHLPGKPFLGGSFQSVDAALAAVDSLREHTRHNIYFCISQQKMGGGKRDRENALGLVCLPMDLDIKLGSPKHYQSLTEAIVALFEFCIAMGIPRPSFMVATGGGLHVYWLSDRVLPVAEWQAYADALKNAAIGAGLKFDRLCTGDAARVLRVPGTQNWKYGEPRRVRLLPKYSPGTGHIFSEVFSGLLGLPRVHSTTISAPHRKFEIASGFKHLPLTEAGVILKEIPLLSVGPILEECGWLREAYETGGAGFDNPQWNLTTLISTFLEDGNALAHKFGNKHETYSFEETEGEWERKTRERKAKNLGWPHCATIEHAGSQHCAACVHRAKEKSPINISYDRFANPTDDEDVEELGGKRPKDLRLPEGFCIDEAGRICAVQRAKKVKGGIQPAQLVVLLLTVIRDPSLQYQNGKFGLGFVAKTDKFGIAEVFLHSGNCFGNSLFNHLAEHCVIYNTDKTAKGFMEKFAPSWLDKLLKEDTAVRDTGTMGWRYADGKLVGFVYGNIFYHQDGTDIALVASTDSDFRHWYLPVGNRQAWLDACKLLTDRKRPELDIIIAIGFAAPLMTFTGTLYGAILSVWGEPGTAKSTAQQVAAAIWGHPKQTRESLNSTPKSVQGRLGRCRNLAAYWDDIQDERHQDALFQTMFVATQGAEGGRLNTDATMKERLDWQTLLVACSNASFVEYLTRKQKSTTAGMRRVFEMEFNKRENEPGMVNATDASRVFGALEQNYGVIGAEYARMLANEHVEIDLMVAYTNKAFCEKVGGSSDESYWWGTCGVLLAGAKLANRLGANLDVEAMEEHLERVFFHNRTIRGSEGTEGGSYANTEQGLVAFLNHFVGNGNVLVVDRFYETRHKKIKPLRDPGKDHPIVVQIARDQRKVVFSKREMRDFLHRREIQARQIFNGMATFFKAKEVRHTMGAGTVYAQGQEVCIEIFVPEGRPHVLSDLLEAQGPPQMGT
jgi:hypothetical protein